VSAGKLTALLQGAKELFSRHLLVWLRGTMIGFAVGIAPALGSTAAVWVAYAQAKQSSKKPEEFGNGAPKASLRRNPPGRSVRRAIS